MSASVFNTKQRTWSGSRNAEGHREFKVVHIVKAAILDGPQVVMSAAGLPLTGSMWNFDNDLDPWAFCLPTISVSIHQEKEGDSNRYWKVENTFSTRPTERCQDETIEDPLLEPQKISGGFVKYTKEITKQRANHSDPLLAGKEIKSSSHEMFRGPQMEFDFNRPTVRIGQNVASLGLETFAEMVDTVNDDVLWGLDARKIKLSNVTWERRVYGLCNFYYTRNFEFDIDFNTFDREVVDEGTKQIIGDFNEDVEYQKATGMVKTDPQNFQRAKDFKGENIRVLLDGNGEPLGAGADPVKIEVEHYPESNFLLLGIPTSL